VLGPIIKEISEYSRVLHIDPKLETNNKLLEENKETMKYLSNKLIKNLTEESLNNLPRNVRAILAYIQTKAFNKYKGEEFEILFVVIFLRMINKSLSDPVYWELMKSVKPTVEENLKILSTVVSVKKILFLFSFLLFYFYIIFFAFSFVLYNYFFFVFLVNANTKIGF
jgi:hypothetical protein